jgi:hypothetical protein
MAGVLGLGWGLWWPAQETDADAPALAAVAASAPASAAASASTLGEAASSSTALAASAAAEVQVAAAVLASAASATAAAPALPASASPAPLPAQAQAEAQAPASAALAAPAPVDPQAQAEPGSEAAPPVAPIRPTLTPEDRQLARLQGERLRASPPAAASAPPPGPVYAVVSRPTTERGSAARSLALMRASSIRLPPPLPDRGELMRSQGEWRAAWWPFASLADAERARVLLAGRGLKADVVEF